MSSWLLKNISNYRRYSYAVTKVFFQSGNKQNYATCMTAASTRIQKIPAPNYVFMPQAPKLYSTTQIDKKEHPLNAEILLTSILTHYKNMGYVTQEYCKKLFDALETNEEQCNNALSPENVNFLMYAIGTQMSAQQSVQDRSDMFQRLWDLLKHKNRLTKNCYLQKLQTLQYNREPLPDCNAFLKELEEFDADLANSTTIYNELLKVACSCGNMQQATEILSKMRENNFALTEENFNALIMGYGRNHDLNNIQTTVDTMQAVGVNLSTETQTTLFIAYLENDEKSKSFELLQKYQGEFSAEQVLKMLSTALSTELDIEMIQALVRELPAEYTSGPELSLEVRQLFNQLLHKGKIQTVKDIITALPTPNFSENQSIDSYGVSILSELFRAELSEGEIIKFAELLKESGKNTRALHLVTEIAMRRSLPTALGFLENLSNVEALRPHYFWPLIMYNFRRHGESGIIATLKHMQRLKTSIDNETLLIYVLPQMQITLENPLKGVKMLIDTGIKASQLLTPVLRHLISQQKIIEALQIAELYPVKLNITEHLMLPLVQLSVNVRATKRYSIFAKLLNELSKHNEQPKSDFIGQLLQQMLSKQQRLRENLRAFHRFVTEMQKIGLKISTSSVSNIQSNLKEINDSAEKKLDENFMQKIFTTLNEMKERDLVLSQSETNNVGGGNTSSFVKHPREMSLDELECHLIELESKGMNTRGVLRRLLQLCVRDNRLERALEIKEKCDKLKVQISPGMLASVFDLYIKLGNLEKANEALNKLQKTYPGFTIDEHKFIDYAALLVHHNQLEAGKELLAQRSAKQRISGGDYVIKNVWNFLTNVAVLASRQEPKLSKEQNLTLETFQFLRQHGYCHPHNAVLGPIVREYLLRGDIKTAISQFKELAEKYKHTPLQFEIMSLLVRLSNGDTEEISRFPITSDEAQTLLKEVTEVVTKVHGTINLNSALVLAFAESGTDNQLRRLLINPEFRVNHELLQKNCEYLGKEGAVRTLLRLAKGARGLNRTINEQTIYQMLLNNFIKTNDYNAALELYEHLEAEDDLKISMEFLKNLVNLLKMNKIDVPSNIALRAQII